MFDPAAALHDTTSVVTGLNRRSALSINANMPPSARQFRSERKSSEERPKI
jgi:hypothetical protein